jgi:hypothetical protein
MKVTANITLYRNSNKIAINHRVGLKRWLALAILNRKVWFPRVLKWVRTRYEMKYSVAIAGSLWTIKLSPELLEWISKMSNFMKSSLITPMFKTYTTGVSRISTSRISQRLIFSIMQMPWNIPSFNPNIKLKRKIKLQQKENWPYQAQLVKSQIRVQRLTSNNGQRSIQSSIMRIPHKIKDHKWIIISTITLKIE